MKELVEYILRAIVNNPDALTVEETTDEFGSIIYMISVANEDMGRVIGKSGKVINSIREIVKIRAVKEQKRVDVRIHEPEQSAENSETQNPSQTPLEQ